jgi:hypothetical protein
MSAKRKRSKRVPVSYRIDETALKSIGKIRQRWGVSGTRAVERALVFAASHPEFSPASAVEVTS